MHVSDKAIVLQSIRRSESQFILKLYTQQHGLVTVAARTGKSPSSKIKAAHILPLSFISAQLIIKQNKEIQQLIEAEVYQNHSGISLSLSKLSIAQFVNEVLIKSVKELQPNPHLYELTETCFNFLSESEHENKFVNLHLYFLSELSKYIGIEPQNNFHSPMPYFDCRNGSFTSLSLAFPLGLNAEESKLFSEFLKVNCLKTPFSNAQRRALLDILVTYYRFHIPGFNELKSTAVLQEVMQA